MPHDGPWCCYWLWVATDTNRYGFENSLPAPEVTRRLYNQPLWFLAPAVLDRVRQAVFKPNLPRRVHYLRNLSVPG